MRLKSAQVVVAVVLAACSQERRRVDSIQWAPRSATFQRAWQPSELSVAFEPLVIQDSKSACSLFAGAEYGDDVIEGEVEAVRIGSDRCIVQVRPRGVWFESLMTVLDVVKRDGRWMLNGVGIWHASDVVALGPDGRQMDEWRRPIAGSIQVDLQSDPQDQIRFAYDLRIKVQGAIATTSARCVAELRTSSGRPPWLVARYQEDGGNGD